MATPIFPESGIAAWFPERRRPRRRIRWAQLHPKARGRSRIFPRCFQTACRSSLGPPSSARSGWRTIARTIRTRTVCRSIRCSFTAIPRLARSSRRPRLVLILYEANDGIRQIFTDGRPLPNNDPDPWWYGYSIGHWEGDTLVAETTGFKEPGWIDEEGTPISSAAKVTERFRRLNYGTLEIQITVDDPKTFTRPWTYKLDQRLMPDTELIEFVCLENNTSLKHLVGK